MKLTEAQVNTIIDSIYNLTFHQNDSTVSRLNAADCWHRHGWRDKFTPIQHDWQPCHRPV